MRFFPLILFAAIAALLLFSVNRSHAPQDVWQGRSLPALSATKLGASAPEPIAIGEGYTLINLFASWCTPCLGEHPFLKQLAAKKLRIVGIAWNDKPEALRAYLKKNGNPYDVVYIDSKGDAAIPLGIRGVPESYLVGPNGKVIYHLAGPIDGSRVNEILPLIGDSNAR